MQSNKSAIEANRRGEEAKGRVGETKERVAGTGEKFGRGFKHLVDVFSKIGSTKEVFQKVTT